MKKYKITVMFLVMIMVAPLMATTPALAKDSDTYKQLNLFGDVFEKIRSQYVRKVSDKKLIESAINGMLSSLDPHSSYMTPKGFDDMKVQTKGEYGGLGMEVTLDRGVVRVVSPIDDTPASRAGIHPGDYITKLDGKRVMGLTLNEAVAKMKGAIGTNIILTVIRKGEKQPLKFTLTRATITLKSVRSHLEGKVGYIRISSFTQKTDSGLLTALSKIKKQLGNNLQGIVLDLRNNPGGLLIQSIAVAGSFLDHGEVVSTRTRNDKHIERFPARKGDLINGKPLIVLINGGSASASEIVAGALQDNRRAIVVGTQSFGKGSVQTIIPLGENGAMRLTTAYYFTPSGNSIQGEGITPDVVVEQVRFAKSKEINNHLRSENDLRGHLANPLKKVKDKIKGKMVKTAKKSGNKDKTSTVKSPEKIILTTARQDYQLNYAVNLLHGIAIARNTD